MDERADVPEITESCWGILGKDPNEVMCAASRMVVKRKGAAIPVVLPCTLLPYDPAFEMGATLAEAARADSDMFDHGAVKLCHPHCAKFCVLGGGRRAMGIEPTTRSLGSYCSTTELHPRRGTVLA